MSTLLTVVQFHFVPAAAALAGASAFPPATFAVTAPRIALTIWAVPGPLPFRFLMSASLSPAPTAPEGQSRHTRDLAHDAADDRVHGDLSSASVILQVVGKTK